MMWQPRDFLLSKTPLDVLHETVVILAANDALHDGSSQCFRGREGGGFQLFDELSLKPFQSNNPTAIYRLSVIFLVPTSPREG